jgi:hypothetical protein
MLPLRLLGYIVRIWLDHGRNRKPPFPLPPVIPVVLHHSATGWRASTSLQDLVDPIVREVPALSRLVPQFEFVLDDLSKASDEQLRSRQMATFAQLVLWALRDARAPERLLFTLPAWADLLVAIAQAPGGGAALTRVVRYSAILGRSPTSPLWSSNSQAK